MQRHGPPVQSASRAQNFIIARKLWMGPVGLSAKVVQKDGEMQVLGAMDGRTIMNFCGKMLYSYVLHAHENVRNKVVYVACMVSWRMKMVLDIDCRELHVQTGLSTGFLFPVPCVLRVPLSVARSFHVSRTEINAECDVSKSFSVMQTCKDNLCRSSCPECVALLQLVDAT